MNGEGCWSTVVCTPAERAALGLTGQSEWLLHCRLAAGHQGNHATDASIRPRADRRLWLEWNDFDDHAQSLIERNPCSVRSPQGAACLYFESHGGAHFFAPSNGHAPTAVRGPQPATGQAPAQGPGQSGEIPRPMPRPGPPASRPPAHPGQVPQQPDRMRMTTDTHIPVVRTATPESANQESAAQGSPSQDAARTGGRPASRPAAPVSGAHANAGGRHDGYRPGRRSTDAEPPAPSGPRPGSRHRMPDATDSGTPQPPRSPAGPPPAGPPPNPTPPPASPPPHTPKPEQKTEQESQPTDSSATSDHAAGMRATSSTPAPGRGDADLAAALSEVAAALENLAAAVRASRNA
ncbi:hypothetical protein [Gordonia sp. SL306]|uniref:hypothetical protein n=1 Tax=Gordonia sp. SL306 TaxID=2995145 RepID=UPI0022713E22|nr:hypothetical protein [Gordonia sp. SL306]WAC53633.1 hypothetical protein OVA31_12930 [Gordonia sp. SL306]